MGFDPPEAAVDYLSDTSNYDSFHDLTGRSAVTVEVGVEGNGDFWAFGPAAVRINTGTTVTWDWTGQGGAHSVVDEDDEFESDLKSESGETFDFTFDGTGVTRYYCGPHKSAGMKGAIVVE